VNGSQALLDVNVPMYAAGRPHRYKEACLWVLAEVAKGRLAAAMDAEAVQEILYRHGALQRWDLAAQIVTELLEVVPMVYPITAADARLAVTLFQRYAPRGVQSRDLIHAAVMQNNGITEIISTDAHFDQIEGITRLDPLQLYAEARSPRRADG
jgi:predicted nucleic acid-binding protein